ncbi:MAG TPA: cytochrome c3 family protein [Thermodesulfovibrionales bacterium]|nr:cytochrome c3 family protein [Thermodesulfovibrionales bacterium]
MKTRLLVILSLVTVMSLFLARVYSGEGNKQSDNKISEKLAIAHTEIFGKLERPQVIFDHSLHAKAYRKEGCKTCHPVSDGEGFIFEFPFKAEGKDRQAITDAYHEKCIGCHTKRFDRGMRSGPVRCGDCHIRKFESLTITYPVFEFDSAYHDQHVRKLKEEGNNDCGVCHHTYDSKEEDKSLRLVYEEGTEASCYYCHDLDHKRGPVLTAAVQAAAAKGLSMRRVSHRQCLNCHMRYIDKGEKAGPVECLKCHTGRYRTIAELSNVPRPERGQPKDPLINAKDGKMKGVPFDHAFHERNTKTCRSCHHETLQACKECHGLVGSSEGGWINLANAYHGLSSAHSCAGCHKSLKSENKCSGCHYYLADADIQTNDPKKGSCAVCHCGDKSGVTAKPIAVKSLNVKDVPEKVTIKVLEDQYGPAEFPHRKIIERLTEISNRSKAATSFHGGARTICMGCHHKSAAEAEAKDTDPPRCRSCHSLTFDVKNMNRPRLLAAYHRQCITCHEKMDVKARGCSDCHKEKTGSLNKVLSRERQFNVYL